MPDALIIALERGVWDVASYRLGRRPAIASDAALYGLVIWRFDELKRKEAE